MNDITHSDWAGADNEAQEATLCAIYQHADRMLDLATVARRWELTTIVGGSVHDNSVAHKAINELRALADGTRVSMTREEYEALSAPPTITIGGRPLSDVAVAVQNLNAAGRRLKQGGYLNANSGTYIAERARLAKEAMSPHVERVVQGQHKPTELVPMVNAIIHALEQAESALEILERERDEAQAKLTELRRLVRDMFDDEVTE